jgi:predicted DNA binding CopG/RHH family protein
MIPPIDNAGNSEIQKKPKMIAVRVPPELYKAMRRCAFEHELSHQKLVNDAVRYYVATLEAGKLDA